MSLGAIGNRSVCSRWRHATLPRCAWCRLQPPGRAGLRAARRPAPDPPLRPRTRRPRQPRLRVAMCCG